MSDASQLRTGKGENDENFPVASRLIRPQHREPILAFYRFARTADDVADHAETSAERKLELLDIMRRTLEEGGSDSPEAAELRVIQIRHSLDPRHALDLLEAFRRDVTKRRYRDWDELMDYCRYSAMPVGRFVLDVHGEDRTTWVKSDAICAALQVINHLQDCAKDYRTLDRVYLPQEGLTAAELDVAVLAQTVAPPALRVVIADLAARTHDLLDHGRGLCFDVRDRRLGLEIAVIERLARDLTRRLGRHDPLSEKVHHRKLIAGGLALAAAGQFIATILTGGGKR